MKYIKYYEIVILLLIIQTVFLSIEPERAFAANKRQNTNSTLTLYNTTLYKAMDYESMGNRCMEQNKYEEAIKWYEKALKEDLGYCDPYLQLTKLYLKTKNYDAALKNINLFTAYRPGRTQGHLLKGEVLLSLGRYKEAIESLSRAIALYPNCAEAYYYRGICQEKMTNYWLAKSYYSQAIEKDSEMALAYKYRANLEETVENDFYNAIKDYEKYLSIVKNDNVVRDHINYLKSNIQQAPANVETHGQSFPVNRVKDDFDSIDE